MDGTALRTYANVSYASGGAVLLGSPWQVAGTGDFNGDGRPDIIWRDDRDGYTQVWLMTGPLGTVWSQPGVNVHYSNGSTVLVGGPPAGVWHLAQANDFNQDGWPDLLWRDATDHYAQLWHMTNTTWNAAGLNLTSGGVTALVGSEWYIVNR